MASNDTYLKTVTNHDHCNLINTKLLLEILGMTGVSEALACHRPLVERRSHKHIDISVLDVLHCLLKRCHRSLCRLRSRLSRLNEDIFRKTVYDVHPFLVHILCRSDDICVYLVDIVDLFLVETEYLR